MIPACKKLFRRVGEIIMEERKITKDTLIADIVELNPDSVEILQRYGMHCLGCALAHMETLEEAVNAHGAELEALLNELNA